MDKQFLMRVSDLEVAIQDYKKGLYSEEEFARIITDLAEKITNKKAMEIVQKARNYETSIIGKLEEIMSPKDESNWYPA